MNMRAKLGIGALAAVAAGLAVTLGVVLASDGGSAPADPYYGMMRNGDWAAMQSYMRSAMGDDAYQGMLGQMHRQGGGFACSPTQMLDYMRGIMSQDAYNAMVAHMRQVWGENWQNMMGFGMWGMMGCGQ